MSAANASVKTDHKIFVGGLGWEATEKTVTDYFNQYGQVVSCVVKMDPATGRCRGFGFVEFSDTNAVEKVMEMASSHKLGGRTIEPKRARPQGAPEPQNKIFVGGVDPHMKEDEIVEYFTQFGKVTGLDLPFDNIRNQRRGFCFVSFEENDAAEQACKKQKHPLGNREVDVRRATKQNAQRGGRGGGRGGYGGGGWNGRWDQSSGYGGYGGDDGGWSGYGGQGNDYNNWGGYGNQGQGNQQNWGGYNQNYQNYGSGGQQGYDYNWGGYNQGGWGNQSGGGSGQGGASNDQASGGWKQNGGGSGGSGDQSSYQNYQGY